MHVFYLHLAPFCVPARPIEIIDTYYFYAQTFHFAYWQIAYQIFDSTI